MFCDSFTTMSTDATLICIDCGGIFPFTAKDQNYFRDHNYSTPNCHIRSSTADSGLDSALVFILWPRQV